MKHKLVIVAISSALALSAKPVSTEEPQFVSECTGWNCTSEGQNCVTGNGTYKERFQSVMIPDGKRSNQGLKSSRRR